MPTTCGFPNCKFRARYKEMVDNRHFYRVPKKPDILRMKWLEAIGRTENNIVGQLRICSGHFLGGEKQEGDVPVADPECNPPLRVDLPLRPTKRFGILKSKPLKYSSQVSKIKRYSNKTKNQNNSANVNCEFMAPTRKSLIGNVLPMNETDNLLFSQIYWSNCMKIMHISGMMFTSMMMANIQSMCKRPTILCISNSNEFINFEGLDEICNIHIMKEDTFRNSFDFEKWNPSTLIIESNIGKNISNLLHFHSLKHIVKLGNNLPVIELNTCSELEISVSVISTLSIEEISNTTLVLILSLFMNIPFTKSKNISDFIDLPQISGILMNKTLGLLGLDQVALVVARKAKLFGFSVICFDPSNSKIDDKDSSLIRIFNLETFLKSCDCISIHLDLTIANIEFINSRIFTRMKPAMFFVNISSPKLLDLQEFHSALLNGSIHSASINVDSLTSSQILCLYLTTSNITLVSFNRHINDFSRKETLMKANQEVKQGLIGYLPACLQYCVNNVAIYNVKYRNSISTRIKNFQQSTWRKFNVENLLN